MYFEDKRNNVTAKEMFFVIVLLGIGGWWLFGGFESVCKGARCPAGSTPVVVHTEYRTQCLCGATPE